MTSGRPGLPAHVFLMTILASCSPSLIGNDAGSDSLEVGDARPFRDADVVMDSRTVMDAEAVLDSSAVMEADVVPDAPGCRYDDQCHTVDSDWYSFREWCEPAGGRCVECYRHDQCQDFGRDAGWRVDWHLWWFDHRFCLSARCVACLVDEDCRIYLSDGAVPAVGQHCDRGRCVFCTTDAQCPTGETCVENHCRSRR